MRTLKLFLISIFLIGISSCKKESSNSENTFELLTSGSWKVIEQSWNPNNTGWSDIYSSIPTCLKDNTITYRSDLTLLDDEGPTKCNISDQQTITGTWSLYSNNTKYSVNWNGKTIEYEILELTTQTLKVYFKTINPTDGREYRATLVH